MPPQVWADDSQALINVQANPAEVKVLRKLETSPGVLNDLVEYSQGVIPYKTEADGKANLYISSLQEDEGWAPLLEGASQVRRYEIAPPQAYIKYGPWLWCEREARFFSQPKILFHRVRKKLPRQLVGVIDEAGFINRHSLSNLILRSDFPPDVLYAVLGLFNSRLCNWWFVKKFGMLMEVGGFKVGNIPLPTNWNEGKEPLGVLVRLMLKLHKEKAGARLGQEKAVLQQQIEATDAQIDRLVYDLYGLTEDEIKIVEAAG